MKTAFIEERSQHSNGGADGRFGGPDRYVAVQVVPEGVEKLQVLNRALAAKRGIEIIFCGDGYSRRQQTSRSMLNQARAKAYQVAKEITERESSRTCHQERER